MSIAVCSGYSHAYRRAFIPAMATPSLHRRDACADMRIAIAFVVSAACASHDPSVTLTPATNTTPATDHVSHVAASCPRSFGEAPGASCEAPGDLGSACTYTEGRCECIHSLHCGRGGAVRALSSPEPNQILSCTTRACDGVAESSACSNEGATCRGPASTCYAFYECKTGRWALVQAGPPP